VTVKIIFVFTVLSIRINDLRRTKVAEHKNIENRTDDASSHETGEKGKGESGLKFDNSLRGRSSFLKEIGP